MSEPTPQPEPDENVLEDGVELSLDELGRAYAKAVGLEPEEAAEPKKNEPAPVDDNAACELSPKSILEALLFVGNPDDDEPLTTNKIASMIRGVTPKEVTALAKELQSEYETNKSAFRLMIDRNKLKLVLAEEYAVVRESFYGEIRKAKLSQQAIDVLAIVAYNQPVKREDVNELRGRECSGIIKQLVKRQLLSVETAEPKSRVKVYRTTDRFLDLFGLETLEDLPRSEDAMVPD